MAAQFTPPKAKNEPVLSYGPGAPERESLTTALEAARGEVADIPMHIGGKAVTTGVQTEVVVPHEFRRVIGRAHAGNAAHVESAIEAAMSAKKSWAALPWQERAAVFLKAADLLAGPFRAEMNAVTMLGQSKTVFQSEIDAVAELCDFWRFNGQYMGQIMADQPFSPDGQWNQVEFRPLDGFVLAVTPFNFTSIAANLVTAPALLGNAVVWKPSPTQLRSAHTTMQILKAAGLPDGVVNLVHGEPQEVGAAALASPELGGLHFTGSAATFQHLYGAIAGNMSRYRQYPRIVGETGGKDFIFAHPSADLPSLSCAMLRGAYEFQGQKCSAASRAYIPRSIWPELKAMLTADIATIKMGDVSDLSNFMGAVIDARSFKKITAYIEGAKAAEDCEIVAGGGSNDRTGWFVEPTLIETTNPKQKLMCEEIFGPVLTVWVYDDAKMDEALELCDTSTPYALTGAIFGQDRIALSKMAEKLRFSAGNFYINDKPTGAVVGQQPFGGGRASGTNDKAGSAWSLLRWASPRTIKETFVPPTDYRYPHMG